MGEHPLITSSRADLDQQWAEAQEWYEGIGVEDVLAMHLAMNAEGDDLRAMFAGTPADVLECYSRMIQLTLHELHMRKTDGEASS